MMKTKEKKHTNFNHIHKEIREKSDNTVSGFKMLFKNRLKTKIYDRNFKDKRKFL